MEDPFQSIYTTLRAPMVNKEYTDAVMTLHEIARMIETKIGTGQLSKDIRLCADQLHELTKEKFV